MFLTYIYYRHHNDCSDSYKPEDQEENEEAYGYR
jgi:hypothetical protein